MTYFNFRRMEEVVDQEKVKKKSPFDGIYKLYELINKRDPKYKDKISLILKDYEDGDLNFFMWAMNHYLFYNTFTRENFDMIMTNTFLEPREYIYFYVQFMIDNKIKFPRFMIWYKLGVSGEDKKYLEIVKEMSEISDEEELEDFISYFREKNTTVRDLCINSEYIRQEELI